MFRYTTKRCIHTWLFVSFLCFVTRLISVSLCYIKLVKGLLFRIHFTIASLISWSTSIASDLDRGLLIRSQSVFNFFSGSPPQASRTIYPITEKVLCCPYAIVFDVFQSIPCRCGFTDNPRPQTLLVCHFWAFWINKKFVGWCGWFSVQPVAVSPRRVL